MFKQSTQVVGGGGDFKEPEKNTHTKMEAKKTRNEPEYVS